MNAGVAAPVAAKDSRKTRLMHTPPKAPMAPIRPSIELATRLV
ncbi:hypothetical protein NORO109296_11190 [Nocardiopsis rhodophaea]